VIFCFHLFHRQSDLNRYTPNSVDENMKHDEGAENTVMHSNKKKKNLDFLFITILLLPAMFFPLLLLYFCKSDSKNYNLIKKIFALSQS
jgi:hypothetical protein